MMTSLPQYALDYESDSSFDDLDVPDAFFYASEKLERFEVSKTALAWKKKEQEAVTRCYTIVDQINRLFIKLEGSNEKPDDCDTRLERYNMELQLSERRYEEMAILAGQYLSEAELALLIHQMNCEYKALQDKWYKTKKRHVFRIIRTAWKIWFCDERQHKEYLQAAKDFKIKHDEATAARLARRRARVQLEQEILRLKDDEEPCQERRRRYRKCKK